MRLRFSEAVVTRIGEAVAHIEVAQLIVGGRRFPSGWREVVPGHVFHASGLFGVQTRSYAVSNRSVVCARHAVGVQCAIHAVDGRSSADATGYASVDSDRVAKLLLGNPRVMSFRTQMWLVSEIHGVSRPANATQHLFILFDWSS